MQSDFSYKHYVSPFSSRYVSSEMSWFFSQEFKAITFRRLWVALAEAEREFGLEISGEQVAEMRKGVEKIDFGRVLEYEKEFRHDVMAHIHAFGDVCPLAKGIIHLGATSSYVADNGDLIQMKKALGLLLGKMLGVLERLLGFARKYADAPTLGYTHYQSAQPTTIGKRACLWLQDFYHDAKDWERLGKELPFLGVKGATGTQASFLALFEGDEEKVKRLERKIAEEFGFEKVVPIASQTYSRKIDLNLMNALESFAASAHKIATDIRLLAHEKEIEEGFGEKQVGSSAMPHKRNPIYAERICGLARFVMSLAQNPAYTTATQWLERSLDDSSNRRCSIPEAFLGTDAILNLLAHLLDNLEVDADAAKEHVLEEIPFLAMESILMKAAKKGKSRQEVHEVLRRLSLECRKEKDKLSFLKSSIQKNLGFSASEIEDLLDLDILVGKAPRQVHDFIESEIAPFLQGKAKASFPKIEV